MEPFKHLKVREQGGHPFLPGEIDARRMISSKPYNGDTQPQSLPQNRDNRCYHKALRRWLRHGDLSDAPGEDGCPRCHPPRCHARCHAAGSL